MPQSPLNGLVLVNKPAGPSSAAVVGKIKHLLRQHGASKGFKIGHGGTLDPFAEGLLPIGLGQGTKALQALLEGPKTYTFTVRFGIATTTQDATGTTTATAPLPTESALHAALPAFTGPILQTPPVFSALKINGHRAYALARQGKTVLLAPRPVTIYQLKLLSFTPNEAELTATVSKGTYIRSLGADLVQAAGSAGHLTRLVRTTHGPYTLAQAFPLASLLEFLDNALKSGQTPACLIPLSAPAAG
jgi:tRNA pseudouridine55 synthase